LGSEDSKRLGEFYTKILGVSQLAKKISDWYGFMAGEGNLDGWST